MAEVILCLVALAGVVTVIVKAQRSSTPRTNRFFVISALAVVIMIGIAIATGYSSMLLPGALFGLYTIKTFLARELY